MPLVARRIGNTSITQDSLSTTSIDSSSHHMNTNQTNHHDNVTSSSSRYPSTKPTLQNAPKNRSSLPISITSSRHTTAAAHSHDHQPTRMIPRLEALKNHRHTMSTMSSSKISNLRQHALSCHFRSKKELTSNSDTHLQRLTRVDDLSELEAVIVDSLLTHTQNVNKRMVYDFLSYLNSQYIDGMMFCIPKKDSSFQVEDMNCTAWSIEMIEFLVQNWLDEKTPHVSANDCNDHEQNSSVDHIHTNPISHIISLGSCAMLGKRNTMEDRVSILYLPHRMFNIRRPRTSSIPSTNFVTPSTNYQNSAHFISATNVNVSVLAFLGVFDGHAGSIAAEYARVHLAPNILKNITLWNPKSFSSFIEDFQFAINTGYNRTDEMYNQYARDLDLCSGSTATGVFILDLQPRDVQSFFSNLSLTPIGGQNSTPMRRVNDFPDDQISNMRLSQSSIPTFRILISSNCGDSQIVLCSNGQAQVLSEIHRPDESKEKDRIEEAGGRVIYWMGQAKVNGVLAVSRAIGNYKLKHMVISRPFISYRIIDPNIDQFVIIASDGVWDFITPQGAVDFVLKGLEAKKTLEQCSKELLTLVIEEKNSKDNCSIVICSLT